MMNDLPEGQTQHDQKTDGAASELSAGLGDIVERLRESDNDTEYIKPISSERHLTLAWEAAAEIERLRSALGWLVIRRTDGTVKLNKDPSVLERAGELMKVPNVKGERR